jgi:hypothetical protein
MHRATLWLSLALVTTAACGSSSATPTPTNTTCPPDNTLTYANFGKPFMETYCVRCHSSELHGSARQGAPLYHDFDSLFGILVVANHVDWYTAAGPDAVNEIMPPNGEPPSIDERYQLGEWLACEVELAGMPRDIDGGMGADAGVDPDAG